MTARELADKLCRDLVEGVYEDEGTTFIVTTFPYPTGDFVTLYVEQDAGGSVVHDGSMTAYWLAVDGVELTETRQDFIRSACLLHDVRFDGQLFSKRVTPETAGPSVLSLCQAIARVSTLRYDVVGRATRTLATEVETLVEAKIAPNRPVTVKWTDPEYDPGKSHLIDYHCNGTPPGLLPKPEEDQGVPSNLFVAGSEKRVEVVTGIIHFWRERFPTFKSLCIMPTDLAVSSLARDRLATAADVVVQGVGGNEAEIVRFATDKRRFVPKLMAESVSA